MKLTWFGSTAFRVHAGDEVIVVDHHLAQRADTGEVASGADRMLKLARDDAEIVEMSGWRPPPVRREIDAPLPTEILRVGPSALLIAAAGEPPLVLCGATPPAFGRWADGALVVLTAAEETLRAALGLLDAARPRLLALALDDQSLDSTVSALGPRLGGTGLVALEQGLALEV